MLARISVFSCENEGTVDLCKAASPKKGKTVLIDVFSLGLSCDTAPCCKKPKDNLSGGKRLNDIIVNSQLEAKCYLT